MSDKREAEMKQKTMMSQYKTNEEFPGSSKSLREKKFLSTYEQEYAHGEGSSGSKQI